jgi:four helix bundle protein
MEKRFRFEDLEIWKLSAEIAGKLFDVADDMDQRRLFRFAEQIRGAALSTPNNIAEGSGSTSLKEFAQFLNIARRSIFENASMLIIFGKRKLIKSSTIEELLNDLNKLARMITAFSRSLKR